MNKNIFDLNPENPMFPLIVFSIALLSGYLINSKLKILTYGNEKRFENVDSLRGFLAIGVFIHHSSVWYQFLNTNKWGELESKLLNQLGSSTVAIFFMISSFLFFTKLFSASRTNFDWKHFFISRFFRLAPLYFISLLLIFLCVLIMSDWQILVSIYELLLSILIRSTFGVLGKPGINNYDLTSMINAGVEWSLTYEWLLYFSLPIIGLLFFKIKTPIFYLALSFTVVAIIFYFNSIQIPHLISLAAGALASFLQRVVSINNTVVNKLSSFIILLLLIFIGQFHSANDIYCKIALVFIFTLIVIGCDFFGVLKIQALRLLGDICYSTYLLHGIILFIVIKIILGEEYVKAFSALEFSLLVLVITPVLIIVSFLGFYFIEKPFMNLSKRLNSYSLLKSVR